MTYFSAFQFGGNNITIERGCVTAAANSLAIIHVLDATAGSLSGRLETNGGILQRLSKEDAVLADAQAWLYGLHTSLLRTMVAQRGWDAISAVPKHAIVAEEAHLYLHSGASGLATGDTLLAVMTHGTFLAGKVTSRSVLLCWGLHWDQRT
jgi:hypothetical protein